MKPRILVVEDDKTLTRALHDNLTYEGYQVECAAGGRSAIVKARDFCPDLVLLDLMLPDGDGFDLCGVLRQGRRAGLIILTAKNQKSDKLRGLDLGADDYVTKPFELEELLARIRAVLRRLRPPVERITLGEVTVNFRTFEARNGPEPIELTHREFELLRYLAEHQNSVVSRDELLREVWKSTDGLNVRPVDHAIARLRKKLEANVHRPRFIRTVHGDGYSLTLDDQQADHD